MYLVSKTFSAPHIYLSSCWYITLTQGAGDAEWTTKTTGAMVKHQIQDREHTFLVEKSALTGGQGLCVKLLTQSGFQL